MSSNLIGLTLKSKYASRSFATRTAGAAGTIGYNYAFERVSTDAPTFVDVVSNNAFGTTASVTPTSNMKAGHLGIAVIAIKLVSLPTLTAPSGWTLMASRANATNSLSVYIYTKTLTSGDLSGALTWSYTGTAQEFEVIVGAYNTTNLSPFDVTATLATNGDTTSSTDVSFASINTASPNDIIIGVGGNRGASNGQTMFSAPSGYTLRANPGGTAAALDVSAFLFDSNGALGSNSTGTLTGTQTISGYSITGLIALSPTTTISYPPVSGPTGGSALVVRGTSHGQLITGNPQTITLPTGLVAGDLILLWVDANNLRTPTTVPSGFTLVSTQTATSSASWLYSKVSTGSDGGTTVSITYDANMRGLYQCIAIAGSGGSILGFASNSYGTGLTSYATPAVTFSGIASIIEHVVDKATTPGTAWTTPAGFTKQIDDYGATSGTNTAVLATSNSPSLASPQGGDAYTENATGSQGIAWSVAILVPTSSAASVAHLWGGAPSSTGFRVVSKTSSTTSVSMSVSTASDMSAIVQTVGPVTPDTSGYVSHTATGLTSSTPYYYQLYDNIASAAFGPIGKAKTLAPAGVASNFTFAAGSCTTTNASESYALDDIVSWNPDFMVHLGDFHYKGLTSTIAADHVQGWADQIQGAAGLKTLIRNVPMFYCRSDHEAGPDNGDSNNTYTQASIDGYKTVVPYLSPLADTRPTTAGLYNTWVVGRVRFIMVDIRNTDRSPGTNTDNSSKTMLGATQKAWLKAQLSQPEPLKIILSDVAWIGPASLTHGADKWWSYDTERQEIANYITTNNIKVMLVHGDTHSLMADDGSSNVSPNGGGGFAVVCASPLANVGGGYYTAYPQQVYNTTTSVRGMQYQRFSVTDDGDTISVTATGWDALNATARTSLVKTYDVSNDIYSQGQYGSDIYPGVSGLAISVWNGVSAVSANITVWDGSVEKSAQVSNVV